MLKPEFFLWSRTMCKSLEKTGFSEFNIVFPWFLGVLGQYEWGKKFRRIGDDLTMKHEDMMIYLHQGIA